jgi:hypothetical protein
MQMKMPQPAAAAAAAASHAAPGRPSSLARQTPAGVIRAQGCCAMRPLHHVSPRPQLRPRQQMGSQYSHSRESTGLSQARSSPCCSLCPRRLGSQTTARPQHLAPPVLMHPTAAPRLQPGQLYGLRCRRLPCCCQEAKQRTPCCLPAQHQGPPSTAGHPSMAPAAAPCTSSSQPARSCSS